MQKIDYDTFANYFYTHIIQELKPFEERRQLLVWQLVLVGLIGTIIAVAIYVTGFKEAGSEAAKLSIYVLGGTFFICGWMRHSFRKKIKKKIYEKLFSVLDLKYATKGEEYNYLNGKIRSVCARSYIYSRYDDINSDDIIYGNYGEMPFYISDSKITYETGSGKNRRTVTVFDGLFLSAKIGKNFKGETLIKTDRWGQAKEIMGRKTVRLEDIEFEKSFEVYGTDQIESRYLLTTAFMNRLLEYKRKKKCAVEVVFSNDIISDENIFIFIHTNKDYFEIPVMKNLLNKDVFYGVIMDIVDALEIVETLKLDQNIGM